MVIQSPARRLCVSKKKPLDRTGLPSNKVTALCPDMEPAAASNTCSGIPDASSATSMTCSEWTPCKASGCSALLVLAEINASLGNSLNSIRSCLTSSWFCSVSGRAFTHLLSSANNASYNCELVGAVSTIFTGNRRNAYQIIAQAAAVLLPTP